MTAIKPAYQKEKEEYIVSAEMKPQFPQIDQRVIYGRLSLYRSSGTSLASLHFTTVKCDVMESSEIRPVDTSFSRSKLKKVREYYYRKCTNRTAEEPAPYLAPKFVGQSQP